MARKTRKFGDKRYSFVGRWYMKSDADRIAEARRKRGERARVIKVKVRGLRGMAYEVWGA